MSIDLPNLPSVDLPLLQKTKPMPKKSKSKSKSKPATATAPATSVGPKISMLIRAEDLCTALASGRDLTADDCLIFEELGWSRIKVERETRRCGSIQRLKLEAGTKADLTLKKTELAELKESTADKVEQLDAQIQAMLDERDGLAFGLRALDLDVSSRSRAMEALRGKVPPHIVRVHGQLIGGLKGSTMNRERLQLESKIRRLNRLPETITNESAAQVKIIANNIPPGERPQGLVNDKGQVHHAGWEAWVASQKVDLPTMVVELQSLKSEFESRMAMIDQTLDFYLS